LLREQGWRVITIWQCALRNENRVFQRLRHLLSPQA
jgi:G:T-mismatch repair DNA endonuclease (very short patch repair protein)